jgi:hypothetical protein
MLKRFEIELTMQFLMIYRPDRKEDVPLSRESMAELGKSCEDLAKAGDLVMSAGLQPTARGARVRLCEGEITVTDGPFSEAKEVIAGTEPPTGWKPVGSDVGCKPDFCGLPL